MPVPTQIVSNEEFEPPDQTPEQKRVEHRLNEIAEDAGRRLGISRRKFLASTGGVAAAFIAMNEVFGNFFDVSKDEMFERQASDEKFPKIPFISDVHPHHVAARKKRQ
ncbi:MAG TPA: hypothetical protein VNA22_07120 [Pyrinomonadaceae bacterium]|nr:hypothetical protein [Pyrinomonadaceae bacterium]